MAKFKFLESQSPEVGWTGPTGNLYTADEGGVFDIPDEMTADVEAAVASALFEAVAAPEADRLGGSIGAAE